MNCSLVVIKRPALAGFVDTYFAMVSTVGEGDFLVLSNVKEHIDPFNRVIDHGKLASQSSIVDEDVSSFTSPEDNLRTAADTESTPTLCLGDEEGRGAEDTTLDATLDADDDAGKNLARLLETLRAEGAIM